MSDTDSKEEITLEGNGSTGSMRYHRTSPKQEFQLDMNSDGKFHFRWHDSGDDPCDVELTQIPNEALLLTVTSGGKQETLRGNTFWHLWIADPEICRKRVAPILDSLRQGWGVASTGGMVEAEVLRLASATQHSDRKQWAAWVEQLGDARFGVRNLADHHLLAAGPPILGFLRQQNMDQLDAEQQFRLRRIIRSLTRQTSEDTPEQAAQTLIEDPLVWLSLLTRSDEATRRTAANQLTTILGETIHFDPAVDPSKQSAELDELRTRLDHSGGAARIQKAIDAEKARDAEKAKAAENGLKVPRPAPAPAVR
jgi:hypothetical protein